MEPGSAMNHIILIGLPGSGKTTVGRLLAQRLGLPFADSDEALERDLGCTIPEIFAQRGEGFFRDEEARTLRMLCAQTRQVIATGGGAVLREENRALLRRSGRVIFLDRAPCDIAVGLDAAGRPLLQHNTLEELAAQRRQFYLDCAHVTIREGRALEAAECIMALERKETR